MKIIFINSLIHPIIHLLTTFNLFLQPVIQELNWEIFKSDAYPTERQPITQIVLQVKIAHWKTAIPLKSSWYRWRHRACVTPTHAGLDVFHFYGGPPYNFSRDGKTCLSFFIYNSVQGFYQDFCSPLLWEWGSLLLGFSLVFRCYRFSFVFGVYLLCAPDLCFYFTPSKFAQNYN